MASMRFEKKYPLPLNELLLAPVVFRTNLPALAEAPLASAAGMRDLAEFGGYSGGAIRTAMSRLRASGLVSATPDAQGVRRYRMAGLASSISRTALARPNQPEGFLLAVFSFTSEDGRERQVVREALKLHGFQKLAQNVYITGQMETGELEAHFEREGLTENVYLFRCPASEDPVLRRKLSSLFDLGKRKAALEQFEHDLLEFLKAPRLDDLTFARRFLYSGPLHHRITFLEEPPLPAAYLPEGYPLARLLTVLPELAAARGEALDRYFRAVHV
jgi:DNA-binding transcriptional regulator PaaX